jgi:acetylornithine/N-succinyldiaminopimelate aminotransferase
MSVGNAALDQIFKKGFLQNVQKISKYFHNELNKIKNDYPKLIKEVRGIGFLIGLQLYNDPTIFIKKLQDKKLLTIRSGENTIRILPPLNVKKSEIDIATKIIRKVCKEF